MIKRGLALLLCASLVESGCAAGGGLRAATFMAPARFAERADRGQTDPRVLAEYVQKLPVGSVVKVELRSSRSVKGTLIKATSESVIVQRNTRIAEAPIEIPLSDITRVTLETGTSHPGRSIAIGAAAGAAAALGVILILVFAFND